jgi:four helix bundle protein
MAKIEKFEDIEAWQKARKLNSGIYRITNNSVFSKDYALRDQIRRSSISIMANIAEGFGRRGDKEFKQFLNIAHGSAAELQSHIYVALDLQYINQKEFSDFYKEIEEISKMLQAFKNYLMKSQGD